MANDFSTGKSIFVLAVVAGCFALLWPNVFYPMIQGPSSQKDPVSTAQGCCDVMFDSDVNAIKVMIEICEKILIRQSDFDSKLIFAFEQGKLTKNIVDRCQKTVFDSCGVDITQFLMDKVRLGRTYKQILDEIRSLNSSLCLKQSFGVSLGEIGLPRRIRVWGLNRSKHLRQERPPHLRPEFLHPALREKGRAIPHTHVVPKINIQDGRSTPLPGIRPPMGGPGQVVPPPKTSGTMGIVMPMYTIGIIVFFLYTMMKLLFKKSDSSESLECFVSDPDFHKAVFKDNNYSGIQDNPEDGAKIGWRERDTRFKIAGDSELDFLKKRLQETEKAMELIVAKMMSGPSNTPLEETESSDQNTTEPQLPDNQIVDEDTKVTEECETDEKNIIKVLGMEMTESCEHGGKWSRPPTPLSRPSTPQNIFISGSLPSKSQLLVSDSHTETDPSQEDAVVLTGKVTLSLIGLTENNTVASENKSTESDHEFELNDIIPKVSSLGNRSDDLEETKELKLFESNGNCFKTGSPEDYSEDKREKDKLTQDILNIGEYCEKQDIEEEI